MPAEAGALQDEGQADKQHQDDDHDPGHALDSDLGRGQLTLLVEQICRDEDEHSQGNDLDRPDTHRLGREPGLATTADRKECRQREARDNDDGQDPAGDDGHVAVHHDEDRLATNRDGAALADDEQHGALKREEHREGDDEARDPEPGHEHADHEADDDTGEERREQRDGPGKSPIVEGDREDRGAGAGSEARREVDFAQEEDEDQAHGEHDDCRALIDEVGEIEDGEEG